MSSTRRVMSFSHTIQLSELQLHNVHLSNKTPQVQTNSHGWIVCGSMKASEVHGLLF